MSNDAPHDPMLAILSELKVIAAVLLDVKSEVQALRKATEQQNARMTQLANKPDRLK